jgi:hypothetical protein
LFLPSQSSSAFTNVTAGQTVHNCRPANALPGIVAFTSRTK